MRIAVVATLYRSSPLLDAFHRRVSAAVAALTDDYEIVLVNDGSPDDSLDVARRLFERDEDCLKHPFDVAHHIGIGDVEHSEAKPLQRQVAATVFIHVMRFAIDFDDHSLLRTQEIGNKRSDFGLATEFVAAELRTGEMPPQAYLRLGRVAAHFAGVVCDLCDAISRETPPPAPPLKRRGVLLFRLIAQGPLLA